MKTKTKYGSASTLVFNYSRYISGQHLVKRSNVLISAGVHSFVARFQENRSFSGDSYLKFNNEFTLPAFACSMCMRLVVHDFITIC